MCPKGSINGNLEHCVTFSTKTSGSHFGYIPNFQINFTRQSVSWFFSFMIEPFKLIHLGYLPVELGVKCRAYLLCLLINIRSRLAYSFSL